MSGNPFKKNGLGVFAFDNGDFYFGEWENDFIQGEGILFFAFGGFVHGFFDKSKLHGPAFLKFSNGEIYEGYWKNGLLDGEAYNYFIDENLWLKCQYSNGKFENLLEEGEGRAPSIILNSLSEMRAINEKHRTHENPRVKLLDFKDGQQFLGSANKNKTCGLGILRRLDGKCDIGFCDDGRFLDIGRINLKDGGLYDGLLKDGKFHGRGLYFNPKDKSWFYGHFENGDCKKISKQGKGKYPLQIVEQIRAQHHKKSNRYVDQIVASNIFYVPTGYNKNEKLKNQVQWQPQKIEQMREKTFSHKKSPKLIRSLYVHEQIFKQQDDLKQRQNLRKRSQEQLPISASPNSKLYQHYLQKSQTHDQDENNIKRSGSKNDRERERKYSPVQNQMYPNQIYNKSKQVSPFKPQGSSSNSYQSPFKRGGQFIQQFSSPGSTTVQKKQGQLKVSSSTSTMKQDPQPLQSSKIAADLNQNFINIQDSYDMSLEDIPVQKFDKEERQKRSKLGENDSKETNQSGRQDSKFIIVDQQTVQAQNFSSPTFNQQIQNGQRPLSKDQTKEHILQMQKSLHQRGDQIEPEKRTPSEKKFSQLESGSNLGDQASLTSNYLTNQPQNNIREQNDLRSYDSNMSVGQDIKSQELFLSAPQQHFRKNTFGEEINQDLPNQIPNTQQSLQNQNTQPNQYSHLQSPTQYSTLKEQPFQSEYQTHQSQQFQSQLQRDQLPFSTQSSAINNSIEQFYINQQQLSSSQTGFQQSQPRRPLSQSYHQGASPSHLIEQNARQIGSETRISQQSISQLNSHQSLEQNNNNKLRLSQYIANNVEEPIKKLVQQAIESDNNQEFLQKYRGVLNEEDPNSAYSNYQDMVSARNKIILNKLEQTKQANNQEDVISFQTSIIGLQDQYISKHKRSKSMMARYPSVPMMGDNLNNPLNLGGDHQSSYSSTYRTNLDSQRDNNYIQQLSKQLGVSPTDISSNLPLGFNKTTQHQRYSSQPNLQRLNLSSSQQQDNSNISPKYPPPLSGKSTSSQQNFYGHQTSIQSQNSTTNPLGQVFIDTLQTVRGPSSQFKEGQMHYQSTSPSVQQTVQSPVTNNEYKQKEMQQPSSSGMISGNQNLSTQHISRREGSPLTPKKSIIKDGISPHLGVSPKSVRFSQEVQRQQITSQNAINEDGNYSRQQNLKLGEITFQQTPNLAPLLNLQQGQNQSNEHDQIANFLPDTPERLNPQIQRINLLHQQQPSFTSQNTQQSNPNQLIRQVESFLSHQGEDQNQLDPKSKNFITKLRQNSPESQQILHTFSTLPQEQKQDFIQRAIARQAESQINYSQNNQSNNVDYTPRGQSNFAKNLQNLHSRTSSYSSEHNFTGFDSKPPVHPVREIYSARVSPKNVNDGNLNFARSQSGDIYGQSVSQGRQNKSQIEQVESEQRQNRYFNPNQEIQFQQQSQQQQRNDFQMNKNNYGEPVNQSELIHSNYSGQPGSSSGDRQQSNTLTFKPVVSGGEDRQGGKYFSPDPRNVSQTSQPQSLQKSYPSDKQGSASPSKQNNFSINESGQYSQSNLNYSQSPEQIRQLTNEQQLNNTSNNNSFRQSNNQSGLRLTPFQQQQQDSSDQQIDFQSASYKNQQDKMISSRNRLEQTLPDEVCEDFDNINLGNFTDRNSEDKRPAIQAFNDQEGQQSFIGDNIRTIEKSSYSQSPDRQSIPNQDSQQQQLQQFRQVSPSKSIELNRSNQSNLPFNQYQQHQSSQQLQQQLNTTGQSEDISLQQKYQTAPAVYQQGLSSSQNQSRQNPVMLTSQAFDELSQQIRKDDSQYDSRDPYSSQMSTSQQREPYQQQQQIGEQSSQHKKGNLLNQQRSQQSLNKSNINDSQRDIEQNNQQVSQEQIGDYQQEEYNQEIDQSIYNPKENLEQQTKQQGRQFDERERQNQQPYTEERYIELGNEDRQAQSLSQQVQIQKSNQNQPQQSTLSPYQESRKQDQFSSQDQFNKGEQSAFSQQMQQQQQFQGYQSQTSFEGKSLPRQQAFNQQSQQETSLQQQTSSQREMQEQLRNQQKFAQQEQRLSEGQDDSQQIPQKQTQQRSQGQNQERSIRKSTPDNQNKNISEQRDFDGQLNIVHQGDISSPQRVQGQISSNNQSFNENQFTSEQQLQQKQITISPQKLYDQYENISPSREPLSRQSQQNIGEESKQSQNQQFSSRPQNQPFEQQGQQYDEQIDFQYSQSTEKFSPQRQATLKQQNQEYHQQEPEAYPHQLQQEQSNNEQQQLENQSIKQKSSNQLSQTAERSQIQGSSPQSSGQNIPYQQQRQEQRIVRGTDQQDQRQHEQGSSPNKTTSQDNNNISKSQTSLQQPQQFRQKQPNEPYQQEFYQTEESQLGIQDSQNLQSPQISETNQQRKMMDQSGQQQQYQTQSPENLSQKSIQQDQQRISQQSLHNQLEHQEDQLQRQQSNKKSVYSSSSIGGETPKTDSQRQINQPFQQLNQQQREESSQKKNQTPEREENQQGTRQQMLREAYSQESLSPSRQQNPLKSSFYKMRSQGGSQDQEEFSQQQGTEEQDQNDQNSQKSNQILQSSQQKEETQYNSPISQQRQNQPVDNSQSNFNITQQSPYQQSFNPSLQKLHSPGYLQGESQHIIQTPYTSNQLNKGTPSNEEQIIQKQGSYNQEQGKSQLQDMSYRQGEDNTNEDQYYDDQISYSPVRQQSSFAYTQEKQAQRTGSQQQLDQSQQNLNQKQFNSTPFREEQEINQSRDSQSFRQISKDQAYSSSKIPSSHDGQQQNISNQEQDYRQQSDPQNQRLIQKEQSYESGQSEQQLNRSPSQYDQDSQFNQVYSDRQISREQPYSSSKSPLSTDKQQQSLDSPLRLEQGIRYSNQGQVESEREQQKDQLSSQKSLGKQESQQQQSHSPLRQEQYLRSSNELIKTQTIQKEQPYSSQKSSNIMNDQEYIEQDKRQSNQPHSEQQIIKDQPYSSTQRISDNQQKKSQSPYNQEQEDQQSNEPYSERQISRQQSYSSQKIQEEQDPQFISSPHRQQQEMKQSKEPQSLMQSNSPQIDREISREQSYSPTKSPIQTKDQQQYGRSASNKQENDVQSSNQFQNEKDASREQRYPSQKSLGQQDIQYQMPSPNRFQQEVRSSNEPFSKQGSTEIQYTNQRVPSNVEGQETQQQQDLGQSSNKFDGERQQSDIQSQQDQQIQQLILREQSYSSQKSQGQQESQQQQGYSPFSQEQTDSPSRQQQQLGQSNDYQIANEQNFDVRQISREQPYSSQKSPVSSQGEQNQFRKSPSRQQFENKSSSDQYSERQISKDQAYSSEKSLGQQGDIQHLIQSSQGQEQDIRTQNEPQSSKSISKDQPYSSSKSSNQIQEQQQQQSSPNKSNDEEYRSYNQPHSERSKSREQAFSSSKSPTQIQNQQQQIDQQGNQYNPQSTIPQQCQQGDYSEEIVDQKLTQNQLGSSQLGVQEQQNQKIQTGSAQNITPPKLQQRQFSQHSISPTGKGIQRENPSSNTISNQNPITQQYSVEQYSPSGRISHQLQQSQSISPNKISENEGVYTSQKISDQKPISQNQQQFIPTDFEQQEQFNIQQQQPSQSQQDLRSSHSPSKIGQFRQQFQESPYQQSVSPQMRQTQSPFTQKSQEFIGQQNRASLQNEQQEIREDNSPQDQLKYEFQQQPQQLSQSTSRQSEQKEISRPQDGGQSQQYERQSSDRKSSPIKDQQLSETIEQSPYKQNIQQGIYSPQNQQNQFRQSQQELVQKESSRPQDGGSSQLYERQSSDRKSSPRKDQQLSENIEQSPYKQNIQQGIYSPEKQQNQFRQSQQDINDISPISGRQGEYKQELEQTNYSQFNKEDDQTTYYKQSSGKQLNKSQDLLKQSQQISPYSSQVINQTQNYSPTQRNPAKEAAMQHVQILQQQLHKGSSSKLAESVSPVHTPRSSNLVQQLDPSINSNASRYLPEKEYSSVTIRQDIQPVPLQQSIRKSQDEFIKSPKKIVTYKKGGSQSPSASQSISPHLRDSHTPQNKNLMSQPFSARNYEEQLSSSNIYSQFNKQSELEKPQISVQGNIYQPGLVPNPFVNVQSPVQLITGIRPISSSQKEIGGVQSSSANQSPQKLRSGSQSLYIQNNQDSNSILPGVNQSIDSRVPLYNSSYNKRSSSNIYAASKNSIPQDISPSSNINFASISEHPIGFEQYSSIHKKQPSQTFSQGRYPLPEDNKVSPNRQGSSSPIYYQTLSPNESRHSKQIIQQQLQNLRQSSSNIDKNTINKQEVVRGDFEIVSPTKAYQQQAYGQRSRKSSDGNLQQSILPKQGFISPVRISRRQSFAAANQTSLYGSNLNSGVHSPINSSQQFSSNLPQQDQRFQTTYSNSYSNIPNIAYKSNSDSKQIQQNQRKYSNPILQTEEIPRSNFQNLPSYIQSPQQQGNQYQSQSQFQKFGSERSLGRSSRRQSQGNLSGSQNQPLVIPPYATDFDYNRSIQQQRPPSFANSGFASPNGTQSGQRAKTNSFSEQYQFKDSNPSSNYQSNQSQYNQSVQQPIQSMTTKSRISPNPSELFSNTGKSMNEMHLEYQHGVPTNQQSSFQPILSPQSSSNYTRYQQNINPPSSQTIGLVSPLFQEQQQEDQYQRPNDPYFKSQNRRNQFNYSSSQYQHPDQYDSSVAKSGSYRSIPVSQQNKLRESSSLDSQGLYRSAPKSGIPSESPNERRQYYDSQEQPNFRLRDEQRGSDYYSSSQQQSYYKSGSKEGYPYSGSQIQDRESIDRSLPPQSQIVNRSSSQKSPYSEERIGQQNYRSSGYQTDKIDNESQYPQYDQHINSQGSLKQQQSVDQQSKQQPYSQYSGYYIPKKQDINVNDSLNEKSMEQTSRQFTQEDFLDNQSNKGISPTRFEAEKKQIKSPNEFNQLSPERSQHYSDQNETEAFKGLPHLQYKQGSGFNSTEQQQTKNITLAEQQSKYQTIPEQTNLQQILDQKQQSPYLQDSYQQRESPISHQQIPVGNQSTVFKSSSPHIEDEDLRKQSKSPEHRKSDRGQEQKHEYPYSSQFQQQQGQGYPLQQNQKLYDQTQPTEVQGIQQASNQFNQRQSNSPDIRQSENYFNNKQFNPNQDDVQQQQRQPYSEQSSEQQNIPQQIQSYQNEELQKQSKIIDQILAKNRQQAEIQQQYQTNIPDNKYEQSQYSQPTIPQNYQQIFNKSNQIVSEVQSQQIDPKQRGLQQFNQPFSYISQQQGTNQQQNILATDQYNQQFVASQQGRPIVSDEIQYKSQGKEEIQIQQNDPSTTKAQHTNLITVQPLEQYQQNSDQQIKDYSDKYSLPQNKLEQAQNVVGSAGQQSIEQKQYYSLPGEQQKIERVSQHQQLYPHTSLSNDLYIMPSQNIAFTQEQQVRQIVDPELQQRQNIYDSKQKQSLSAEEYQQRELSLPQIQSSIAQSTEQYGTLGKPQLRTEQSKQSTLPDNRLSEQNIGYSQQYPYLSQTYQDKDLSNLRQQNSLGDQPIGSLASSRQFSPQKDISGANKVDQLITKQPQQSQQNFYSIADDKQSVPQNEDLGQQSFSYKARPNISPDQRQQSFNISSSFQDKDPYNLNSQNQSRDYQDKSHSYIQSSPERKDLVPSQNSQPAISLNQINKSNQPLTYNQPYFDAGSTSQVDSQYFSQNPVEVKRQEQSEKKRNQSPEIYQPASNYSIPQTYQKLPSAFDTRSLINPNKNESLKRNILNEDSFGAPKFQNTQSLSSYQSSPPKQQGSINISQDYNSLNQMSAIIPLNSTDAKNREVYKQQQMQPFNQSVEYFSAGSVIQYPSIHSQDQINIDSSQRSVSSPHKNLFTQDQQQQRQSSLPHNSTGKQENQIGSFYDNNVPSQQNQINKEVIPQIYEQNIDNRKPDAQERQYFQNELQSHTGTEIQSNERNQQGQYVPKILNSQSSSSNNRYTTPMQTAQFNNSSFDDFSESQRKPDQRLNTEQSVYSNIPIGQSQQRQQSPLKSNKQDSYYQNTDREPFSITKIPNQGSIQSSPMKSLDDIQRESVEFQRQPEQNQHYLGYPPSAITGINQERLQPNQAGASNLSIENKSINQQNPLDDSYRTYSQVGGREPHSSSLFNPLISNNKNQTSNNKLQDNTSQWYSQNNASNYQTFQSPTDNLSSSNISSQQNQTNYLSKPNKNAQIFSKVSEFPSQQQNSSYFGLEDNKPFNQQQPEYIRQLPSAIGQGEKTTKDSHVVQKIRAIDIQKQDNEQISSPLSNQQTQQYPVPKEAYSSINNEDEVNYRTLISHASMGGYQGQSAQKQYQSQKIGDNSLNLSLNDSVSRVNPNNSSYGTGQNYDILSNPIKDRIDNIKNIENKIKKLSQNIISAVNESQQQIKQDDLSNDSVRDETLDQVPEDYEFNTNQRNQNPREAYKKSRYQQKSPQQNEPLQQQHQSNQNRYNQDVEGSGYQEDEKKSHRLSPYSQMYGHSDNSTTYIHFNSPPGVSPLNLPFESNYSSVHPNQSKLNLSQNQNQIHSAPLVPSDHRSYSQPHQMQRINLNQPQSQYPQQQQVGTQYLRQNAQAQNHFQQNQSHIQSPIKLQQSISASPYRQQVFIRTPQQFNQHKASPIQQGQQYVQSQVFMPAQRQQVTFQQSTSPYNHNQNKSLSPIKSSLSISSSQQNNTPIKPIQKEIIYKTHSPQIIQDHQQRTVSANRLVTETLNQSVNNLNQTFISQGVSPYRNHHFDDSIGLRQSKVLNMSQSIVSPQPNGKHIIISPVRDNYMFHSLAVSRQIPLSPSINPLSASINGNSPSVSKTPLEFIKFHTPQKQQMFRSERLHTASPEIKRNKEIDRVTQKRTRNFLSCCKNDNADEGEVEIEPTRANLLTLQQLKQQQSQQNQSNEDNSNCNIF